MFGLGKKRTRFGVWLDRNDISQQWLVKHCGVDKNTASRLCGLNDYRPNYSTKSRVIGGLRKEGHDVYMEDFWPDE